MRAVGMAPAVHSARSTAGRAAADHLIAFAETLPPVVALFAGHVDEIDTQPLFERLSSLGVPCAFPRSLAGERLDFALVDTWSDLVPGRFGILEPPAASAAVRVPEEGWVVVPGVAFDPNGNRLGRGRGFYDRAFPSGASAPSLIGFVRDFQVVNQVPAGSHDRKMDAVVTEVGVRYALVQGR